jgi:Tol biopolymer transport system component
LLVEAAAIDFVKVSPKGDRVAFFGTDAQGLATVEVADLAGGRKVLSTGWVWVRGLAWSPSSDEIWFTAKRVGEHPGWFIPLYAVNLSGRQRLLMSLPAWTNLEDLSHEGRVLMILGSRQNEMFGRIPGAPHERDLAWNESSWAIDLSQDGRKLLFQEFAEELYREEGGGLYVRGTDGSPAVRIGQGYPGTLAPDGKRVAVCPPESQARDRVLLVPVGAGETQAVPLAGMACRMVQWFPDGRKLLVRGERSGEGIREYLVDTQQGAPRPVTPEGTICISGSIFPNGRELACRAAEGPQGVGFIYPVDGGEPRAVRGLMPGDRINGVRDDRTLSLERDGPRPGGWPAQLFWLDLATAKRTLFLELQPADPTGVLTMSLVATRDFQSYVYSYDRELNALYLVDRLR